MKIAFKPAAAKALYAIADFVESKNTPGSGKRYALKFRKAVEQFAQPNVKYTLCNDKLLALLGYSCRNYNDWIIAFKIENNRFVIYEIILGSTLP